MEYTVKELMRPNITSLIPYSSARNEFTGNADVFLDANENWQDFVGGKGRNRYPDPLQRELKRKIEEVMHLPADRLVVGNGSDEIIDLLFRIFCVPVRDKIMVMSPTYGAYKVFADINDVGVSDCPLKDDFSIDMNRLEAICHLINSGNPQKGMHKMLFICSPNNPSGNSIPLEPIEKIATCFKGITVVDEAYFEFSGKESAVTLMDHCPRLVVMRTFSKSWGLANARVGLAVASRDVVDAMNKVKYPYNMSGVAQELAIEVLSHANDILDGIQEIVEQREKIALQLKKYKFVLDVYPSDANFLLVRVDDPNELYHYLRDRGIVIRNRSTVRGCDGCVRITIGSAIENQKLLSALDAWEESV